MKETNQKLDFFSGFTLVEVIVTVAILAILSLGIFGIFTAIFNGISYYRERATVSALADKYLEIARNLPYSEVGTLSGNPHGDLPDLPNALDISFNNADYQIYYVVNYIDDPADGTALLGNDSAPNDYKQIKFYIKNVSKNTLNYFATNIVPQNLEGLDSGGALHIKVFDAVGQPVSGATIHITNTDLSPEIDLTRLSGSDGTWTEVGLPNSDNSYHITVIKNDYSSDQTYPSTVGNPDPVKSDSTVSNGQVTYVTFSIDYLSNLVFNTYDQDCQAVSQVGLQIQGAKLIGTPDVLKFDNTYISNSNGQITLSDIEWDNYTPYLTGSEYMVYGSSPIQQVSLLPNTSQEFSLILGSKTDNSLLVIVKDASTSNPIEGVDVNLQTISPSSEDHKTTGGSVRSQQSWVGGSGQDNFVIENKYFEDDGNISNNEIPDGLRLLKVGESYVLSGELTSSTFDTGTDQTEYTTLTWQPTSQDPAANLKFQLASNNDSQTWNYIGSDGTSNTYYTTSGTSINELHDGDRYIRYKVFLSTSDTQKTPVLTSININYVSGCFTPGQVMFSDLPDGQNYNLTLTMAGYQTQTIEDLDITGNQTLEVLMSP